MNYIYFLIEIILLFLLMILFYRFGKKNGLFMYIVFLGALLSIVMFKSIDVLSFEVDLGIPIIMGIFICSNIIVQKYGIDEIKDIIKSFVIPYVCTAVILSLTSLIMASDYNINTSDAFDSLFGYNLDNLRLFVSGLLSIGFMLWYNAYVYYYIRKNKNKFVFSNIGSLLMVQFIESIIFVFISYIGVFDFTMLFGMIVIRYLLKVVIGFISLLPIDIILKMKV